MNAIITAYRLKTLRDIKGLTMEQIAKKAELNLNDYKDMESGRKAISKDKLKKACDALGIEMEDWFDADTSKVIISSGEFKTEGSSGVGNFNCDTCNFNERNDESIEMLKSLTKIMQVIIDKIDNDAFSHEIDQIIKKDKDKPKEEE